MYEKSEYKGWSIKDYRKHLQKTAPEASGEGETLVGTTIRFFSIFLTRILAFTSLTPNMITTISVFIFFGGISMFAFNETVLNYIGILLIYISIIFDASDGEIARLKGNKSGVGGIYTEPISHDIQYSFMFFPLTIGQYLATGEVYIIYVGFIAMAGKMLLRISQHRFYKTKQSIEGEKSETKSIEDYYRKVGLLKRIYRLFNREIFSSVGMIIPLLFFTVLERMDLFIWCFAIVWFAMFVANFLNQVIFVAKLSK